MGADITIKANSQGIVVVANKSLPYDNLVSAVIDKFVQCKNIFCDNCVMPVTIKGSALTNEEYNNLLNKLNNIDCIKTTFTINGASNRNDTKDKTTLHDLYAVNKNDYLIDNYRSSCLAEEMNTNDISAGRLATNSNYVFKGTLKAGEELSIKNSVIIAGDVEKGALVMSGGNIIILGNLFGKAIAGKISSTNRFILALNMRPEYIQIGNINHIFSKKSNNKVTYDKAVIAYKRESSIVLENVSHNTSII